MRMETAQSYRLPISIDIIIDDMACSWRSQQKCYSILKFFPLSFQYNYLHEEEEEDDDDD